MDDINTFGHVAYGIAYSPMLLQPSDGNPYTHDYNPGTLVSAREDDTVECPRLYNPSPDSVISHTNPGWPAEIFPPVDSRSESSSPATWRQSENTGSSSPPSLDLRRRHRLRHFETIDLPDEWLYLEQRSDGLHYCVWEDINEGLCKHAKGFLRPSDVR
ncbi:hypothetical protein DL546_004816 [Coniochaeta pulveracea]|uniref:Uncharacterized protein n=1 Tax=Coniochaeta pulveracea TaxID=177199 RepID=A0A420Y3Y5_9PEZI|nr:hypothetical protein DL546_004816 [Coniochaeta pulveracea]